jgi:hypothetical protein
MKARIEMDKKTLGAALALAALALLCLPPGAGATYDPIGGGTTRLVLDQGLLALIKREGVTISALAPARRQGKTIILPVSGGKADPTKSKLETEQEGSLVFAKAKRQLPLRKIELKTKRSPLFAKAGGGQLKIASARSIAFAREGFGSSLSAKGLALTQKLATRLNKKLRTGKAFKEGQPLGTLEAKTLPQRVTILPQGQATLVPDPAILAKLKSLFVSLNPISPAELSPGPVLGFPIAGGGQLAPTASEGTLRLGGAIELLQLGAGQLFQREYWLDLGLEDTLAEVDIEPTPAFPGKLGQVGTFAIDMSHAVVSSDPKSRTISVSGAALALDVQTAQSFNEAFGAGKAVFSAGESFGVVSFAAVGQ